MDVDRESRKRSRADMLEKGSAKEDEDNEEKERTVNRKLARRGVKKIQSDEEGTSGAQESSNKKLKEQARHVLLSDYEDADCFVVTDPPRKEGKGEEVRAGTSKEEQFGVVLKKKRGGENSQEEVVFGRTRSTRNRRL